MSESVLDEPCVVGLGGQLVPFPKAARDEYWAQVARNVEDVFGREPSLATDHRAEMAEHSRDTQIIGYNRDPLSVAADICGIAQLTEDHLRKSLQFVPRPNLSALEP